MMLLALGLGALWTLGCLLAVALCVAARRVDDDVAAGRTPEARPLGADRFARSSFV